MLFFRPRLNILIFLPIWGWKYSGQLLLNYSFRLFRFRMCWGINCNSKFSRQKYFQNNWKKINALCLSKQHSVILFPLTPLLGTFRPICYQEQKKMAWNEIINPAYCKPRLIKGCHSFECFTVKFWIFEIMGFVRMFWKKNVQEASFPKISISG